MLRFTSFIVAAATAAGLAGVTTPTVSATEPAPGSQIQVAYITEDADKLHRPDVLTIDILTAEGYDVVLVDVDDVDASAALDTATLGVISSSVAPDKVPTSLATTDLPLLNFEGAASDDLGLATQSGEQKTNTKNIVMFEAQAGHPLAAGLTGHQPANIASQITHNFGAVGSEAIVIATTDGQPAQPTYYAYEAGTELASGAIAPARRVAHFSTELGPLTLTAVGKQLIIAAVDWLAAEPAASAYADDIIDLRGDWHFEVYRKYSNMFQFFNFGGVSVTWEDPESAQLPTSPDFAGWETVAVPSPDYSTGGLLQMVRPGSGDVRDDRTRLTDFDMFPKWSEAWFARTVEIPAGFLDETDDVTLMLGIIDDLDVVYINGTPVGAKGFQTSGRVAAPAGNVPADGGFDADGEFRFETSYWEVPRQYEFDASLLHEGTNELTVRLYNNNSFGGFYDRPMALVASGDAVRFLKDMPTEELSASATYQAVVDAQVAAIESEDPTAYAATLDDGYVENELDKAEKIASMQTIFDQFEELQVEDVDTGFYWYRGAPVYSAERLITGVANGQRVAVDSNEQHLQYFVSRNGVARERGNMSHTYAVDYVSELDGMQGRTLRYNVYLPPSYYSEPDRSFPVVYLLHGINSTGDSFVNVDQIESRMNEWIENGSITEMILVMPNSGKSSGYTDTPAPRGPNDSQGPWASHIYVDILDQIESNYRTIPDAQFRGLTGISMGGGGVFKIGLQHPEIYTSFASHMGAIPDLSTYADVLDSSILPSLDFYIDHGLQDEMVDYTVSERAALYLESLGANLEFELRDGGHNSAFYMAGMQASMAMHSAHFIDNGLSNP